MPPVKKAMARPMSCGSPMRCIEIFSIDSTRTPCSAVSCVKVRVNMAEGAELTLAIDARIVDENIDPAEFLVDFGERRCNSNRIGHVL